MNLTKTKVAWSERSKKYRYHSEEIHSSWNHWSKLLKDLIRYHDIWTKIPWKCISFMCKNSLWKMIKTLAEKIFRQINYLVNSLVESLFSRNFCQIYSHQNIFSSNKLFSQFLPKKCKCKFLYHTHNVEITEIYSHSILAKISWNQHIY